MATIEKQPAATAAKAAALQTELAEREARAAELRASIPRLRAAEEDALRFSLRTKPRLRAFAELHGDAAKARRVREKAEADLEGLNFEMPFLREEAAAAVLAIASADARRLIRGLADFPARYEALWSDLRAWHAEGVARWLAPFTELCRAREEYVAAAKPVIGVAGVQAEWSEVLERFRLGDDVDKGLPKDFADVLERLNAEFHLRDFAGAGADLIRERPEVIRPRTMLDEGPTFEMPAPTRYRWLDLGTAPVVEEDTPIGRLVSREWDHPDVVSIDHPPVNPDEQLGDGSPRWRRVVVEEAA